MRPIRFVGKLVPRYVQWNQIDLQDEHEKAKYADGQRYIENEEQVNTGDTVASDESCHKTHRKEELEVVVPVVISYFWVDKYLNTQVEISNSPPEDKNQKIELIV